MTLLGGVCQAGNPPELITWGLGGTAMLGRGDATNRDGGGTSGSGYKILWVTGPSACFRKGIELTARGRKALSPMCAVGTGSAALITP